MRLLYPSSNAYGVPDLVLDEQERAVPTPVVVWGSVARTTQMDGTWTFYTDDRRFARLWDDPDQVCRTQCHAVVEPNYSVTPEMPRAEQLWHIYRKRWLARYWQTRNVTVWVDLYVGCAPDVALLGVPRGWRRYATRGADRALADLEVDWELAHIRDDEPTLLVYGGGAAVAAWCRERGCLHIPSRTANQAKLGEGTRHGRA